MKNSNIFFFFLVTFFVLGGNEVVTAARIDQAPCNLNSYELPSCAPKECNDLCATKFNPWLSPSKGYCV
ncbi:hypothetical protein LINGRAHAP2_LOCUS36339, partial [Linum grandiflorum]